MVPPCTLPEKLAVSGVMSTVIVSWWAGMSKGVLQIGRAADCSAKNAAPSEAVHGSIAATTGCAGPQAQAQAAGRAGARARTATPACGLACHGPKGEALGATRAMADGCRRASRGREGFVHSFSSHAG